MLPRKKQVALQQSGHYWLVRGTVSWEKAPLSPESCPAVCLSCVLDLAERGLVNCPVSTLPDAVGKIQSHQYMGDCQPTSRLVFFKVVV